jgi:hypothetical protein
MMMPKCNIFYEPFFPPLSLSHFCLLRSFLSFALSLSLGYIFYDDDVAFVVGAAALAFATQTIPHRIQLYHSAIRFFTFALLAVCS